MTGASGGIDVGDFVVWRRSAAARIAGLVTTRKRDDGKTRAVRIRVMYQYVPGTGWIDVPFVYITGWVQTSRVYPTTPAKMQRKEEIERRDGTSYYERLLVRSDARRKLLSAWADPSTSEHVLDFSAVETKHDEEPE